MTAWIIYVFSILFIPWITLAADTTKTISEHKDNSHSINQRTTNKGLNKSSTYSDHQLDSSKIDTNYLNQNQFEIRKRRSKKKRQIVHLAKPSARINKSSSGRNKQKGNLSNENKNVRIYETFEEIHEHINEPADDQEAQYQASERYESNDHQSFGYKSDENEKKDTSIPMKIKVKHHHHHHHHNHIKEIVKTIPKPYAVEKIVHVPIEKVVEKIIHVPKIVNVTVEKIVHVPVERIIEKIVRVPKPVHVPKPYVIEKVMEKIVHVPKPYPVIKTVPYPVEIKVPVAVEKKVPIPIKVEVERKVPIYIHSQEPYKYEQISSKHLREKDTVNFNTGFAENSATEYHPSFISENYHFNKINPFKHTDLPRKPEFQPIDQHKDVVKLNFNVEDTSDREHQPSIISENYNLNRPHSLKLAELKSNAQFRHINQNKNIDINSAVGATSGSAHPLGSLVSENYNVNIPFKPNLSANTDIITPIEQSAAESHLYPVKFLQNATPFQAPLAAVANSTLLNFNPQTYENKLHEFPIAFPIEFIQVQPMPFQSPFRLEIPALPGPSSLNNTT